MIRLYRKTAFSARACWCAPWAASYRSTVRLQLRPAARRRQREPCNNAAGNGEVEPEWSGRHSAYRGRSKAVAGRLLSLR